MIHGRFQAAAEGNVIFLDEDIEAFRASMRGEFQSLNGDIRAAGDISGGGDGQILMVRQGTKVLLIDEHQEANELLQARYWVETLRYLGIEPWQFTIDGGGMGSTVATYMEQDLHYVGLNRFMANNAPSMDFQFQDRYTELHWDIKELLAKKYLVLPWNARLIDEARRRKYVEMTGEKIKCQPKKEHRKENEQRSPDRLDTLVYLFNDYPFHTLRAGAPAPAVAAARPRSDRPTKEELGIVPAQDHTPGPFQGLVYQLTLQELRKMN